MAEILFISSYFLDYILPFVLVFTLIFAILQKTELLGEDKKQINAILGLVIGVILIATPFARDIVVKLMPFLAVFAAIMLVFMLIYGFAGGKVEDRWVKIVFGIIGGIALVIVILFSTGWWDFIFKRESGNLILVNGILLLIIAGAIIAVILGEREK